MALFRVANERAQFDAASNDARDQYGAGIRFTQEGNARVTTSAGTFYNQGIPMSGTGQVAIVDATAGLPSGTIYHNGLPMSGDKVCVSKNATAVVSNGLPFDSAGALAADINFDLNFIGTDTLNSSVTFTRASTATYFNSAGVLTSAAIDVPRFDYDPATLAARGLLIEEARTNSIRNNTMQGAVAGTPGTLPTNWAYFGVGTLTTQIVGSGVSAGINYVDIKFSGTTSTTQAGIRFEPSNVIVAANGQSWSYSLWSSVVGGSTTNINLAQTNCNLFNSGAVFVGGLAAANINTTSNLIRASGSGTIATATTAFIQPQIYLTFASGAAIDITLRIGLPQLEQGAFATSVIPTTTTALTRSADVASVNTLSPWFNQPEGGLYVEWQSAPTLYARYLVSIEQAATSATRIDININSVNAVNPRTVVSGAAVATLTGGTYTGGGVAKIAFGYKSADYASSFNGAAVVTATTAGALPSSLATMYLGSITGGTQVNGWLRRFTYYPRRPSNAELVTLSA